MGTSSALIAAVRICQDHPHAYGDKSARVLTCLRQQGSSPRVWGQGDDSAVDRTSPGIIPTRMGTSLPSVVVPVFRKDHPHAYGDKKLSRLMAVWILGSSPRVWGQAMYGYTVNALKGIIPTRMGTSECISYCGLRHWDHPHAYGDKFDVHVSPEGAKGSSPRVWGQVNMDKVEFLGHRIIPTRMGTSSISKI